MGLSRLDNFLKSSRGTILYVDPNSLDATDSIENQGNSLTRPFKTIQRALVEAARFSYQRGLDNDRFGKTTILLYPGDHVVDNRPGLIPDGTSGASVNFLQRDGNTTTDFPPFDLSSNFDLDSPNNELFKLNSVHGGVIVPRGTSIVGMDLRKTKVRPKYVPDPENNGIERTALFRVTGVCYFWQFTMFDGNPNGIVYKDYTSNTFVPSFSHHKLTCFEYADGVNNVKIDDGFITNRDFGRTDLDMYYEKVGIAYGQSSGRAIEPDYPSTALDIQPKIDEYRIVGSTGVPFNIESIIAGDGSTSTKTITVTLQEDAVGLDVDTPFRIEGVAAAGFNGQFVVTDKVSARVAKYTVQNAPSVASPAATGAVLSLQSDTVTSASPYIFNCSLRSVFGMNGLHADGSKATGFKSMVVAQFTGVGLQKDDKAFVKFNQSDPPTGNYDDYLTVDNLSNDSRAIHKPEYRNFHIKCSNNSVIQAVSCFAIGYAEHFATESGGDISLTNSNSNFGAKSLVSSGFRNDAFSQDNLGYITHIVPPKEVPIAETSIEFESVDVAKTIGLSTSGKLFIYGASNIDVPPENIIEGYRLGAKSNDDLKVLITDSGVPTTYDARIVMDGSTTTDGIFVEQKSALKSFNVERSVAGINSIGGFSQGNSSNVLTLTSPHTLANGETVRVTSDTGQIPDGLEANTVYFAITDANSNSGLTTNVNIKLAKTFNEAVNGTAVPINEKGGALVVESRVSDKNSGDLGHPIQYVGTGLTTGWYVNVSTDSAENNIYSTINSLGTASLGAATPRTFLSRRNDNRGATDTVYRMRYVIPAIEGTVARPPVDGFILQESNTTIGVSTAEVQTYFGSGELANENSQRNFRFIADATWDNSTSTASIITELPHNLTVGSEVELFNVKSSTNATGVGNSGFNLKYVVSGISSTKQFTVGLSTNPGTFTSDTSSRNLNLPRFQRKRYSNTYYVYRINENQKYVTGKQDGVYYLTMVNASNSPSVSEFSSQKFSQPVKNLFPQTNRDDPKSDPKASKSFASSGLIGDVIVDDPQSSLTRETLDQYLSDYNIGVGLTDIVSTTGTAHTIHTSIDHGLNRIVSISTVTAGAGYGSGSAGDIYNARLVGIGTSVTGVNATAKITVDGSGTITAVKIMDGGSSYGIGNTMAIVGIPTFAPFTQAVVQVDKIYDNVGDSVRVLGITSAAYSGYNNLYRITEVGSQGNSLTVESSNTISGFVTTGIGATATSSAFTYTTGESIIATSYTYDAATGIATVVTQNNHGLAVNRKTRIAGTGHTQYDGDFIVTEILDDLSVPTYSFSVNVGVSTLTPTATTPFFAYHGGIESQDGAISAENENIEGRMVPTYAGITTTLLSEITSATSFNLPIRNPENTDFEIGDYLMVDEEIMRVKDTRTSPTATIQVFRGVLGTKKTTHSANAYVKKIRVNPVEFRRHSIIRASGHTFEYVGFGPGNYSTALPDKHDRAISPDEELLSQSYKQDGGINFYTGMNDKGISYSGNKKLSTITGREEIFDTPIQTVTGEDISNLPDLNVISPVEASISRALRVEGGPDGKVASQFNGPLIVNNKITSNSTKGIEATSMFLQGDANVSRKYTVGISTPILSGNPGDVINFANPDDGGYLGWVFTTNNEWRRFGNISLSKETNIGIFDQVGVGTTSPGTNIFQVGFGSGILNVDADGVGIGTTANGFNLRVAGGVRFDGTVTGSDGSAGSAGDVLTSTGTGVTFSSLGTLAGWTRTAANDGIYNTDLDFVGIGTTTPRFAAEIGAVGAATTTLLVNGVAKFAEEVETKDANVLGIITAANFKMESASGQMTAGIVTTTDFNIGTGATVLSTSEGRIGIGSVTPTVALDIGVQTKFKTYSEEVEFLSVSSGIATVDLSKAQSFICTATADITTFEVLNAPSGSTSFTLRVDQDSTGGRSVGIDTFRDGSGSPIPIYWPGGSVPVVTTTASRVDIYSFKSFGSNITTFGLYGVIGGQNFA